MSITRITSNVLEDEFFQGAFQNDPDTTTETEWGYEAGYAAGTADVELIAASTVSYTAPSYIYVDWNKAVPTIESVGTTDSPPAEAILLYEVRSPTDFTDYRTWTSTSYASLVVANALQQTTRGAQQDGFTSANIGVSLVDGSNIVDRIYTFAFMLLDPTVEITGMHFRGQPSSGNNLFSPAQRRVVRGVHAGEFAYEVWCFRDEDAIVPLEQTPTGSTMNIGPVFSGASDFSLFACMIDDSMSPYVDVADVPGNMWNATAATTEGAFTGIGTYSGAVVGNTVAFDLALTFVFMKGIGSTGDFEKFSSRSPYSSYQIATGQFNTGATQADNMYILECIVQNGDSDPTTTDNTFELKNTPGNGQYAMVDFQLTWDSVK